MSSEKQVKEIMSTALKQIEENKSSLKARIAANPALQKLAPVVSTAQQLMYEQAMQQHQAQLERERSAYLIMDSEGRTIDKRTGEVVLIESRMPTLKANMKAQKRDSKTALGTAASGSIVPPEKREKLGTETDLFASGISSTISTASSYLPTSFLKTNKLTPPAPAAPVPAAASTSSLPEGQSEQFFDPRLKVKTAERHKRKLMFNEKGKYEEIGKQLRTKAKLQQLLQEIQVNPKKKNMLTDSRLALIQPKRVTTKETVPMIEWWDFTLLNEINYDSVDQLTHEQLVEKLKITNLIEHPVQMKPPTQSDKKIVPTVMLTKKERKKLRRQNRNEALKEEQEKIRLGLLPPPEPKVKISNLMRVLGTEAVQDPTKVEEYVRNQMAKRQKTHEEANASRKLTDAEKAAKKKRKIMENTSLGVNVAVYRVKDLSDPAVKFKLEANCNQLHMTGIVLLFKNLNVVVVEGGPKQQKKFKRLMLNRIKWSELTKRKSAQQAEDAVNEKNSCALVWEGQVKTRNFGNIIFKMCPTATFAREHFKKLGCEHYWDSAQSDVILEMADS